MIHIFNKKTLEYKKINIWLIISGLLIFIATSFLCFYSSNDKKSIVKASVLSPEEKIVIIKNNDKFSVKKFIRYINELNFKFPEVVYAKAKTECGFTSTLFIENNNLFGMKVAKQRITCNIGEQNNHAAFNSWRESVQDYAYYFSSYLSDIRNKEEYYQLISNLNYSETPDTLYISSLRGCEKEYFSIVEQMKKSKEWELDSYSLEFSIK